MLWKALLGNLTKKANLEIERKKDQVSYIAVLGVFVLTVLYKDECVGFIYLLPNGLELKQVQMQAWDIL